MELVSRLYTLEQRVWTDVRLKAECVSRGMIDQLLDHCRDPETENSLRSASVACLAALAHGQATVRDEIVRKGAVSVLTGFVCDQSRPICLLERSLLALRKLSCSSESHLQISQHKSGLPRLLTICQSLADNKFSSACEEFEKVTAGCQLVGSVFVNNECRDPLYTVDLYDTSGEEDVVISELLVKSGHFRWNDGEKSLCQDEEGRFWVSALVASRLDREMKFKAQLYKIENVGGDNVLIPIDQGKSVVCCLRGLQFVTEELLVVEHTLGILRNITTVSASIRQTIVRLDGVNVLLKLVNEHEKRLHFAIAAVTVITNLALDCSMRQQIGRCALQPLCGTNSLIKQMLSDELVKSCLMEKLLGCLKNLFLDCVANRMKMIDGNKWLVVVDVMERSRDEKVKEEAMAALRNLWANALDGERVDCLSSDVNMESIMRQRGKRKGFGPGEWISRPTCAVWSPDMALETTSRDDTQQHSTAQSSAAPGLLPEERVYQLGEIVSWCVDESHEIPLQSRRIAGKDTARTICAFLNAEKGGTIYFGVNRETGTVLGVRATRRERDVIRCSIDKLLNEFTPRVLPDISTVSFVPVRACESDKGYPYNPSSLTDLYVIEINIKRFAGGIIYYTPCNSCYIRHGKRDAELTAQLVRDNTLKLGEQMYASRIRSLKMDIVKLRRKLQPLT